MGKVEDSQHAKSEGEARGDQEEKGRPGNPAHELAEKDVKGHIRKSLKSKIRISKPETNPNFQITKFIKLISILILNLEFRSFEIVSNWSCWTLRPDFGLRI
jgi:hypothetical protein